jgi:hypothetical protein
MKVLVTGGAYRLNLQLSLPSFSDPLSIQCNKDDKSKYIRSDKYAWVGKNAQS